MSSFCARTTREELGFGEGVGKPKTVQIPNTLTSLMAVLGIAAMVYFMRALFVGRNLSAKFKQLLATSNMRIVGSYGLRKKPNDIDVVCYRLDYQSVVEDLIKIHLLTGLQVHCFCYGWDWFVYKETPEYRILCAPGWTRILHATICSKGGL